MGVDRFDVAVVGAGFGGLAAALRLAELGARVVVHERLVYPGGCAGTFERQGYAFAAGATVAGGFGPGQPFDRWTREHQLRIASTRTDPHTELRWDGGRLPTDGDRERFVERFGDAGHSWFARQTAVADRTWPFFEQPGLLPPLDGRGVLAHLRRLPSTLGLVPLLGRTAGSLLPPDAPTALRLWVDAGCRISVQCAADEAEAVFALSALDWWWRGVAHVRGGTGALAWALVEALRRLGVEVRFADRVRSLRPEGDGWRLSARSGEVGARRVIANLLPADLARLLGHGTKTLDRADNAVRTGWGAVMLYAVVREPEGATPGPTHLQLVDDPTAPLVDGNHAFVSVSARSDGFAPEGLRTMTISTHADLRSWPEGEGRAERVAAIQERMRGLVARHAPEWSTWTLTLPASPRTFERFVGRGGWVGGVPLRAGRWPLAGAFHRPVAPGLWRVGDAVFPGQSILSTTVGGQRVAEAAARGWLQAERSSTSRWPERRAFVAR
ncbi:MAG: FAD-dependent oxidoreductase [Alphaproteobacteria bacterium]|nr:FAD-dependent oxidoreductase [Alphaproteobacteria bacterium]MCB9695666.1 FAD-dependent oxidoreductase [Alphaproteobacteria bacterium]